MKKNLNVIITVGTPGSGKTTWTKGFLVENENYVRISRDDYRLMLRNETYCAVKIEETISTMVEESIMTALDNKLNVIVDATHVRKKYINSILNLVKYNADVSFKLFNEDPKTCIERDSKRENPVGEAVINKMYANLVQLVSEFDFVDIPKQQVIYKTPKLDSTKLKGYIFDLDGTLCHTNGKREIFDYAKVIHDEVDHHTLSLLNSLVVNGKEIIFLTGREEVCRKETQEWLDNLGLTGYPLFMRTKDDYRKDTVVKMEIYENKISHDYSILGVFEDRISVTNMFRNLGLKVYSVNNRKY